MHNIAYCNSFLTIYLVEVRELSLKRNHGVTIIVNGNGVQCGNGTFDLVGAQETKDTELGETSVVEFGGEAAFLGLGGHVLVEAKGIVEVWYEWMDKEGGSVKRIENEWISNNNIESQLSRLTLASLIAWQY